MANEEHKPSSLPSSPALVDGFWFSAGLLAFVDWLLGKRAPAGELTHSTVRFEHSDVNVRGVVLAGFGVLLFAYIAVFVLYFVFSHFKNVRAEESPPPLPIEVRGLPLPPEPRLQHWPGRDLQQLRATENFELHHYAWVDRQSGTVSIPIERAMDLVVQRGIPPQKAPPNAFYPPSAGTRMTGLEGKVEPEPR